MDNLVSRYTSLTEELQSSNDPPPKGDELLACCYALDRVITFLAGDQTAVACGAIRKLSKLYAALLDFRQGAKPTLFEVNKPAHRSSHLAFDAARAQIAVAACILIDDAGIKKKDAGQFLADECAKHGVKRPGTKGQPALRLISKNDILRWRDEGAAGGPLGAQDAFKDLSARLRHGPVSDVSAAKLKASKLILGTKQMDPRNRSLRTSAHTQAFLAIEETLMNQPKPLDRTIEPIAVTIPDAIRISGLSRSEIYRRLAAGDLEAIKSGTRTLILLDSVKRYLASLPTAQYRGPKAA